MLTVHAWETFYVIVGSAAAALTGLQFVVIALAAEASAPGGEEAVQAFGTPTVVHFCAVLLLSAILSIPGHTVTSLSTCVSLVGAGGLVYAAWVLRQARRQTGYAPVFEDWLWHAGLPLVAYAALLTSGLVSFQRPGPALYAIAAASLMLLFIGIHNAWDAAIYLSARRKDSPRTKSPEP